MSVIKNLAGQMSEKTTETGVKEIATTLKAIKLGQVVSEKTISRAQMAAGAVFGPSWLKGALTRTRQPESILSLEELKTLIGGNLKQTNRTLDAVQKQRLYGGELSQWM